MNRTGSTLAVEGQNARPNAHRPRRPVPPVGVDRLVESALESSPAGLIVLCRDRTVRLVTRAAAELLGLNRGRPLRTSSLVGLLQACNALNHASIRLLTVALEDASDDPQELLLTVGCAQTSRAVAVDIRPVGPMGWVLTLSDVTQTRQTQDWLLEHLSSDPVTGLWNRAHLMLMLREKMDRLAEDEASPPLFALLIGLHHFRRMVETLSVAASDMLLRMVGEQISEWLEDDDVLAYFGEGEFALISARPGGRDAMAAACARLLSVICRPIEVDGCFVSLDARAGVAAAPKDGRAPEELMNHASLALHSASFAAPGKMSFFEPGLTERAKQRRAFEADLSMALGLGEFELHYQPQVDVHSGRVAGLEALIRWRNPHRGLVPPIEFIALAEQSGLILEIGDWVLHEACRHAVHWPEDMTVAINASPLQFESGTFASSVAQALAASELPAHRLEIEVTESLLLRETGAVIDTLSALRALGVRLVLDDFGTGYASLGQLSRFTFDKIKIDRSFISSTGTSPQNSAIVRAIAALGHSLRIPTTAEGVETELQLAQITANGCTCVQGYFFSRPVPAADVLPLLQRLHGETPLGVAA